MDVIRHDHSDSFLIIRTFDFTIRSIGVPMATNCAPQLFNTVMNHSLLEQDTFNDTLRYLDDVLVLNNPEVIRTLKLVFQRYRF